MRDAVANLGSTLGSRPVDVAIPDDLPDVDADQLLIGQVLANLLDNADRYSPPDSLITVAGEARGDQVSLSVADRGPGVPASEREAVFDRYVRFDTGGRAGLGLAIAKTFVEAHGGQIWVEDVPGGGARFVFSLARASANGSGVVTMAKVLVIDDDPSLLRALRLGLQAGGYEVVTAVNGEQGISQTALSLPDVVVLDLGLPDIDGQAVCRRIRQWSGVPIIILSASGTEDRKVAALDGGADDYVTKPFGMAELEARIRTAIRHHRSETAEVRNETIATGPLELDLVHHEARLDGSPVDLTSKEFDVLAFLARHAGRTCTHQMILAAVWGTGYGREARYLHAYVHRLRQKLDDRPGTLIRTMPGVGYSLCSDPVAV